MIHLTEDSVGQALSEWAELDNLDAGDLAAWVDNKVFQLDEHCPLLGRLFRHMAAELANEEAEVDMTNKAEVFAVHQMLTLRTIWAIFRANQLATQPGGPRDRNKRRP